jgi:hypothetical protein
MRNQLVKKRTLFHLQLGGYARFKFYWFLWHFLLVMSHGNFQFTNQKRPIHLLVYFGIIVTFLILAGN